MQGEPTWNWICTELSPSPTPALQIERLREEGSRQLEEQQRLIREQIRQEQIRQEQEQRLTGESPAPTPASHSEVAHSGHTGCSVKLIWKLLPAGTLRVPHLDTCHLSFLTVLWGFSLCPRSPGRIYVGSIFGADHQGRAGKALGPFVSVEL